METDPPPGADRERLKEIADGFREQSNRLRRTARFNILSIVATVLLMTVLVLVLPPLVNVVEDKILASFGYQTSQIDFQRETARQAADVRARSQQLLRMLSQRDQLLQQIETAVSQPLGAFAPEYLATPDIPDQPIVFAVAQAGDLQVAVGRGSRSESGPPLIAYRMSGDADWLLAQGLGRGRVGTLVDAAATDDSVLVAGQLDGRPLLARVGLDGVLVPVFDIAGPIAGIAKVAVSSDGAFIATASWIETTAYLRVHAADGTEAWSVRFPAFYVADLTWSGGDLLVLSGRDPDFDMAELRTYSDAANRTPVEDPVSELARGIPIGFAPDRSAEDGFAIYILQDSALRRLQPGRDGSWSPGGLIDGAELGVGPIGTYAFEDLGDTFVHAGRGTELMRVLTDRRGPTTTSIPLRSATFEANFLAVHAFDDGKLRLSPNYTSAPHPDRRAIFYVEAPAPDIPALARDEALLALLEGVAPAEGEDPSEGGGAEAPLGGDRTAEAEGIRNGGDFLSNSVAPVQEALRGDMLLAAGAFQAADQLNDLATEWRAEWNDRENSATILARLRQADQAGSLWRNVSSLAARLAVIALLIYLVNILVNLYRYNMRLAAFYQARGDAIDTALTLGADLRPMAGTSLAELAQAHTPEEVTFGTRPAPPTDALLKAIQELAKAAKP